MIQDLYKILGLSPSATKEEIKKAYRKLALEWHPDKNKSPNAHEMFIKINEAYLILYDEQARAKYDKEYEFFFGKHQEAEQWKEDYKQEDSFAENTHQKSKYTYTYNDPDLNNWSESAKRQASKYASMSFEEFGKLLGEVVKETGRQGFTAIIYAVSGVIGASGFFSLIGGIRYGDIPQIILSIVFLGLAIAGFSFTSKKYQI
ncbi:MAG: DnaJ-like protein MG200 [Flavobacteriales bacterium]|nr:DnaJ-like protein MG200 [Flavobacteriales bacterium]